VLVRGERYDPQLLQARYPGPETVDVIVFGHDFLVTVASRRG
jgi:hypothetical protein